jgi:mlo protein
MLLGFISLLLTVFQGATQKICVRESVMHHLLPCSLPAADAAKITAHFMFAGGTRRLLAGGGASSDYCLNKVRVRSAAVAYLLCVIGFARLTSSRLTLVVDHVLIWFGTPFISIK